MTEYDPNFDYRAQADRLLLAFRPIAESVDIEQMIVVHGFADALGPFIDPTAYMNALDRGDMHDMEALCQALLPAVKVWNERIAPKVPSE